MSPISRREFVGAGIGAAAGLVIGFYLPHKARIAEGFLFAERLPPHHSR